MRTVFIVPRRVPRVDVDGLGLAASVRDPNGERGLRGTSRPGGPGVPACDWCCARRSHGSLDRATVV